MSDVWFSKRYVATPMGNGFAALTRSIAHWCCDEIEVKEKNETT